MCGDGRPLRVELDGEVQPPSLEEARQAQRGLPAGKKAVFNQYTGEFQAVDAVTKAGTYGDVSVSEPLYPKCGPGNEPVLAPLSEIDPQAAQDLHRELAQEVVRGSDELTGLGGDPAGKASTDERGSAHSR